MADNLPIPIPTVTGSLDMASKADRGFLRNMVRKRWDRITNERRDAIVDALWAALQAAGGEGDYGAVNDITRTFAVLEKMNQDDEIVIDKNDRLDSGKATESIAIVREP